MVQRVIRYVSTSIDYGIHYPSKPSAIGLEAFCDADWAGCTFMRRSTTGSIIMHNQAPISWKSIRQTIVALSTAESEYIALSTTAKEISWLRRLVAEILQHRRIDQDVPMDSIPIITDSTAAKAIASSNNINARTKHIDVRFHHVRDMVQRKEISLRHISSVEQVADILTKPLGQATFQSIRPKLVQASSRQHEGGRDYSS